MPWTGPRPLRALVFDVQGTLLDFFTPVAAAVADAFAERGVAIDLDDFVGAWRRFYFAAMTAIAEGGREWRPTDRIYREGLDRGLDEAGIADRFDEPSRDELSAAWTRLVPWPDTVAGLASLRARYTLLALSNGGMGATIAMSARHDLAFHAILTGELVRSAKPHPSLYRLALDSLALDPAEAMMVASHPYDLESAMRHGMRGAFVVRPHEFGPRRPNDAKKPDAAELEVAGIVELASRLGCA